MTFVIFAIFALCCLFVWLAAASLLLLLLLLLRGLLSRGLQVRPDALLADAAVLALVAFLV
jgi:hypothetical protein